MICRRYWIVTWTMESEECMKIAIEIDLKKLAVVGVMAASTWIACKTGMGDALLFIIPGGLALLFGKEQ